MVPHRLDQVVGKGPVITTELHPPVDAPYLKLVGEQIDGCTVTSLRKTPKQVEDFGDLPSDEISVKECTNLAQIGRNPVPTITCRDYHTKEDTCLNKLVQAGIRNALILYGDPNEQGQDNVYDVKAAGALMEHIRAREDVLGLDPLCLVAASDPTNPDAAKQVRGLAQKIDAGANLTMTQPVFSEEQALPFLDEMKSQLPKVPILLGALVMKGQKSPAFIEKRLFIRVPENVKNRMETANGNTGFEVAEETALALKNHVAGFHVYPFGLPEKATQLISILRA